MKKILLLLVPIFLLSACATPYQKKGFRGGWSELQLSEDTYQVAYSGNAYTSQERVSDFALLRSASLTLENGYKFFALMSEKEYSQTSVTSTEKGEYSASYTGTLKYDAKTSYNTISRHNNIYIVKMSNDKPSGLSYNAAIISKSIKEKYGIK